MELISLNKENVLSLPKAQAKSNIGFTSKPNTLEKTPKQDEVHLSTQNKKKSNSKILIAIAAIGIGIGTAVGILRGKAKKTKILNSIPDDLKSIFAKIKDKNGDEFVDEAYGQMVKHLGLEGIAPSKIARTGGDGLMTITGGFNPSERTIGYSDGFFTKLDKKEQLNMISHELKHCKQTADFIRTEGIGIDAYARAWAETCVQNQIKNSIFGPYAYQEAVKKGKGEEFLENLRTQAYEELKKQFEEKYSDVLKLPKISADSDEGKRIYELFEGCKNYEGLDMFGLGSEEYRNNPLEKDAYSFGEKIQKLFSDFISASK